MRVKLWLDGIPVEHIPETAIRCEAVVKGNPLLAYLTGCNLNIEVPPALGGNGWADCEGLCGI